MTEQQIKEWIEKVYEAFANWYHDDGSYDTFLQSEAWKIINNYLKPELDKRDEEIARLKGEWKLSEEAHDITFEQLRNTQEARNRWREMCHRLAEKMRKAEWGSPLYWEFLKLKASYETGDQVSDEGGK
jgi:hypothetical protein